MASVNYAKLHGAGEAKAMMRHCDSEERLTHEHSNADLDKSRTELNTSIEGLSYSQACDKYDRRIAELDAKEGANRRKDRVTCMGLNVPRPEDLPADRQADWFRRTWDLISEQYGAKNMIEGYIHADEIHEYVDADTGKTRMSREHMHVYVVPEREGKLNAKACMGRAEMVKLNNAIERMSLREFGCHFLDGSGKKGPDVETCKAKSREANLKYRERRTKLREKALDQRRADLDRREDRLEEREREAAQKLSDAKKALEGIRTREEAVKAREEAVEVRESQLKRRLRRLGLPEDTGKDLPGQEHQLG